MLFTSPLLKLFDPKLDMVISANASSFGLWAVLFQRQSKDQIKPVAYISRSMTPQSRGMPKFKREPQCLPGHGEVFSEYLTSFVFYTQTDYKPLVPIISRSRTTLLLCISWDIGCKWSTTVREQNHHSSVNAIDKVLWASLAVYLVARTISTTGQNWLRIAQNVQSSKTENTTFNRILFSQSALIKKRLPPTFSSGNTRTLPAHCWLSTLLHY